MSESSAPITYKAVAVQTVEAEIIENYMPPFPSEDTRPSVVIRCGEWFLRYSKGPKTGTFWDIYGEDFQSIEIARCELAKAPPVPHGKGYVTFTLPINRYVEEKRKR